MIPDGVLVGLSAGLLTKRSRSRRKLKMIIVIIIIILIIIIDHNKITFAIKYLLMSHQSCDHR